MLSYQRFLTTLVVITMSSCSIDRKSDLYEEEERIKMVYPNWVERSQSSRNPDDYFEGVTDDFILMGCGFDPLTIDSIRWEVKEHLESDDIIGIEDCQSHEIIIRDDVATHRYSCTEVLTSRADTSEMRVRFNYLDILRRTHDDMWKIHLHMGTKAG